MVTTGFILLVIHAEGIFVFHGINLLLNLLSQSIYFSCFFKWFYLPHVWCKTEVLDNDLRNTQKEKGMAKLWNHLKVFEFSATQRLTDFLVCLKTVSAKKRERWWTRALWAFHSLGRTMGRSTFGCIGQDGWAEIEWKFKNFRATAIVSMDVLGQRNSQITASQRINFWGHRKKKWKVVSLSWQKIRRGPATMERARR